MKRETQHRTEPLPNQRARVRRRLARCVRNALPPAWHTALWLLKITVPISLATMLLSTTGLLAIVARAFEPLFALFGLPGEAALVFVTGALVNNYSAIVVMGTLGLSGRAITILALMCLFSHNLPMETAVQRRVGTHPAWILTVRLGGSLLAGLALHALLPPDMPAAAAAVVEAVPIASGFLADLTRWGIETVRLCGRILALVTGLMILQRVLEEFGIIQFLGRLMKWPLVLLGVPSRAAFLWIVANTLGLAYGAGVILDHVETGKLSRRDADLLNYHIALSHSLLEDTLLFVAVGAAPGWIVWPRILLAGVVVWGKRLWTGQLAALR